jgi:hypothetical protein
MNGMNAEACADKQGRPAAQSCAPMMPQPQRAPIGKSATACDFALRLMRRAPGLSGSSKLRAPNFVC